MPTLAEEIAAKIAEVGPVNFETFMEMALYHPGLGYYTRESSVIGKSGDFYTSPHLHGVFGMMIARQIEEMWHAMGRPDRFDIVEMGPGMGYLAGDILRSLRARDLFGTLSYVIVELNPWMRARQAVLVEEFSAVVRWVSSLHEVERFSGCLVSNELLDALPVRLIEMEEDVKEIFVSTDGARFVELKRPCSPEVKDYLRDFSITLPEGYRTEVNLRIRDWLEDAASKLSEGFIFTIDYGYPASSYYDEERNRGTLLAYYRHAVHEDPYANVGEQDLTAHVNFSSLKKWGEALGMTTIGFCSQGTFLVAMGIDEVLLELWGDSPDLVETARIKNLLLPQGMGQSHKVMVQYKGGGQPVLKGFSLRNRMRYL